MKAPEEIHGVRASIFSVSRFYGGCTAFGVSYTYDPTRDVLVRDDVLSARAKAERDAKEAAKKARLNRQQTFLEE